MVTFKDVVADLSKSQSRQNWEKFRKGLKASGAKYYSVTFDKGKVNRKEDLRKAFAVLYDSKSKPIYNVPIVISEKGKMRGATIYLKGLLNVNKVA